MTGVFVVIHVVLIVTAAFVDEVSEWERYICRQNGDTALYFVVIATTPLLKICENKPSANALSH